ncbi:MAG: GDSL-type esterase/lipase family protein [Oscillospiraceae bacterium]|nr:GDSL-type esterase/lipase family protein [Oscillospiraceae bacterium]
MKNILCFGDSNTYGLIPGTNMRYPFGVRWTSILSRELGFEDYHIAEEGLCGRTTIFDDPLREGRCGVKLLPAILETHAPLDYTIIMLGTNDCKTIYNSSAEIIGKGIERLIRQVKTYSAKSEILIISPIHLGQEIWKYDKEFSDRSIEISKGLSSVYREISIKEKVHFLDAAEFAGPGDADREHLDENGHKALANEVLKKIS